MLVFRDNYVVNLRIFLLCHMHVIVYMFIEYIYLFTGLKNNLNVIIMSMFMYIKSKVYES